LRRIVEDHVEGRGCYLRENRKALTIELLHRALVENRRETWPIARESLELSRDLSRTLATVGGEPVVQ